MPALLSLFGWLVFLCIFLMSAMISDDPSLPPSFMTMWPLGILIILGIMWITITEQTFAMFKRDKTGDKRLLLVLLPWFTLIAYFLLMSFILPVVPDRKNYFEDVKIPLVYLLSTIAFISPLAGAALILWQLTKKK